MIDPNSRYVVIFRDRRIYEDGMTLPGSRILGQLADMNTEVIDFFQKVEPGTAAPCEPS